MALVRLVWWVDKCRLTHNLSSLFWCNSEFFTDVAFGLNLLVDQICSDYGPLGEIVGTMPTFFDPCEKGSLASARLDVAPM